MTEDVLVLGATGLVGQRVVRQLVADGRSVLAASRRAVPSNTPPGVRWIRSDATTPGDVAAVPVCSQAISTLPIELTADLAPRLQAQGLERLVAVSSAPAGTHAESEDPTERALADRSLDAEERTLAMGLAATVLRPTVVYGDRGDTEVGRIAEQLQRLRFFPLVGGGRGLRQPVHADDVATAAVRALSAPATVGRRYDVAGSEALTVREMVARIGAANGVRPVFVPVAPGPARRAMGALRRMPRFQPVTPGALHRMDRDLTVDNAPAALDLGFQPRPFEPPDYRVGAEEPAG
ncbi:SDR family oxidoreductase [Nocardioides pantholopis]|uniref:SDR family oxidoreductase n=1 Tax=Nocardioides pantholopis TaxID=2483798 RepID=UPI000FD719D5|nr:NAD-dependent epimerase/dehydratase family protein [Nocardioides pantholopis]